MFRPAQMPIEIDQGTVWRRSFRLKTGTPDNNSPIDLTGCQIKAQIRENWSGELIKDIAIEPVDLAAGAFDAVIDDRSRAFRKFDYHWDLLVITADGLPIKYLEGPVKVRTTITRTDGN